MAFRRPDLDRNVLAQNVTAFTKTLMERGQAARRIDNVEKPDHRHRRLLCARRERPRGSRASEKRDKCAATMSTVELLVVLYFLLVAVALVALYLVERRWRKGP
jgi:hypothetical protein